MEGKNPCSATLGYAGTEDLTQDSVLVSFLLPVTRMMCGRGKARFAGLAAIALHPLRVRGTVKPTEEYNVKTTLRAHLAFNAIGPHGSEERKVPAKFPRVIATWISTSK